MNTPFKSTRASAYHSCANMLAMLLKYPVAEEMLKQIVRTSTSVEEGS